MAKSRERSLVQEFLVVIAQFAEKYCEEGRSILESINRKTQNIKASVCKFKKLRLDEIQCPFPAVIDKRSLSLKALELIFQNLGNCRIDVFLLIESSEHLEEHVGPLSELPENEKSRLVLLGETLMRSFDDLIETVNRTDRFKSLYTAKFFYEEYLEKKTNFQKHMNKVQNFFLLSF